jgi:hypothetical protein
MEEVAYVVASQLDKTANSVEAMTNVVCFFVD